MIIILRPQVDVAAQVSKKTKKKRLSSRNAKTIDIDMYLSPLIEWERDRLHMSVNYLRRWCLQNYVSCSHLKRPLDVTHDLWPPLELAYKVCMSPSPSLYADPSDFKYSYVDFSRNNSSKSTSTHQPEILSN